MFVEYNILVKFKNGRQTWVTTYNQSVKKALEEQFDSLVAEVKGEHKRSKAAWHKDHKYTSDQEHEKNYKRKTGVFRYTNKAKKGAKIMQWPEFKPNIRGRFIVWNHMDGIPATQKVFGNVNAAVQFLNEWAKRFETQGYYKDNKWKKIPLNELDMEIYKLEKGENVHTFSPYVSMPFKTGGKTKSSDIKDIPEEYNVLQLPQFVYRNGEKYVGTAGFINGWNGYDSTEYDGVLSAIINGSAFDSKGKPNYLTDEKGNILRAKTRRGMLVHFGEKDRSILYETGGPVDKSKKVFIEKQRGKYVLISLKNQYSDDPGTRRWANEYFKTEAEAKQFAKDNGLTLIELIELDDRYSFEKVSREYAEKNWKNQEIYAIDLGDQSDRLIEDESDLNRFDLFGIETFKTGGKTKGLSKDEKESRVKKMLDDYLRDPDGDGFGIFGYTNRIHEIMIGEDSEYKPSQLNDYLEDQGIYGYTRAIKNIYEDNYYKTGGGISEDRENYSKTATREQVQKLYDEAMDLFKNYTGNSGKLNYSDKDYGYLSDELEDVEVGYFKTPSDSDYAQELVDEGFEMSSQEAYDVLKHRIESIKEDLYHEEVRDFIDSLPEKYHGTSLDEIPKEAFTDAQWSERKKLMDRFNSGTFKLGGPIKKKGMSTYRIKAKNGNIRIEVAPNRLKAIEQAQAKWKILFGTISAKDLSVELVRSKKKAFEVGGNLKKGINVELEHRKTIDKIKSGNYSIREAAELIAKDHLKENKNYYDELAKMEKKFAPGGLIEVGTYPNREAAENEAKRQNDFFISRGQKLVALVDSYEQKVGERIVSVDKVVVVPSDEEDFWTWFLDGNVIENADGSFSTQDAQYRNRLSNIRELKAYFRKEFFAFGGGLSFQQESRSEIERRIRRLKDMLSRVNEEDKPGIIESIKYNEKLMENAPQGSYLKRGGSVEMKAASKFSKVMSEFADGSLSSSSGDKVTDIKQALAIAYSEARDIDPTYGKKYSNGGPIESKIQWIQFDSPIETDTDQRYSSTTEFALKLRGDETIYNGSFHYGSLSDKIEWKNVPPHNVIDNNDLDDYVTQKYFDQPRNKFKTGGSVAKSKRYVDLSTLPEKDILSDVAEKTEKKVRSRVKWKQLKEAPEVDMIRTKNAILVDDEKVNSSETAEQILRKYWDENKISIQEHVNVMFLNRQNVVIGLWHAHRGGLSSSIADRTFITAAAVKMLASGVIIAHNHPSNTPKPSDADEKLTNQMKKALEQVDVVLLDHLIICPDGQYYSFADNGKM